MDKIDEKNESFKNLREYFKHALNDESFIENTERREQSYTTLLIFAVLLLSVIWLWIWTIAETQFTLVIINTAVMLIAVICVIIKEKAKKYTLAREIISVTALINALFIMLIAFNFYYAAILIILIMLLRGGKTGAIYFAIIELCVIALNIYIYIVYLPPAKSGIFAPEPPLLPVVTLACIFGIMLGINYIINSGRERYTELKDAFNQTELSVLVDPVTGVGNRRALHEAYAAAIKQAKDGDFKVQLIICSVDKFNRICDKFGTTAGEHVVTHAARIINKDLRVDDLCFVLGDNEIAILLKEINLPIAVAVAQRLRGIIESRPLELEKEQGNLAIEYTMSFGVHECDLEADIDSSLRRACEFMYLAKKNGRNRVEYDLTLGIN